MATVFDVAKYITEKKPVLTAWKLQKLCYYSQAWQLAWTDYPIFQEDFEAWANGPVCPALYQRHRGQFRIDPHAFKDDNSNALTDDEKDTIDVIIRDYGDMTGLELRNLTHSEEPWKRARGTTPEGASCNTVIEKDWMAEYYGSL